MATPQLMKQLKPCIEQLEDLLASSESFGAFATSLDRCVEILQELLRLSSSLSAVKVSRSMPHPNADCIFKNTISVANDAVQLQANITAQEGSCSQNRTLEEFLPEPGTRVKDSYSRVTLFNPKQNLLSERHLAHRLHATLNLMEDMHKLLVFYKSSFFGSDEVSDSTGKFSQVSSALKETISMTEATAQTQTSKDCDLARICHTLNKPVLIATNALCLLFEFLVVDHMKFGSDLGPCQSAVHIFVNAVGVLNDLTQFFSEGYPNLKESRDKLAQSKNVIVKYCAEIFSPKTNDETDSQSMWSDDFLVKFSKNICDVIIPQSLQDIKYKGVGTFMESSKNTNVNITQNVCNGDTSTNLQSISAFMCSYQVTSNKNMNDVSIVQNSCSIKFSNVDTSTALQSMLVRTNSFQNTKKQDIQDTRVTKPKECFVLDEFTEYFKGSCALAGNPATVENAACTSKKLSGCSEHVDNLRKTCADGTGVQDEISTDDSEWRSILTEGVESWYTIDLKTSADLAAPAHFFCDSIEANFVFLNNGQKHRVAELVTELKDAMNFFSIKENSARLQFFCHACRRYVASKKVRDHVVNEQHLCRLRVEAKRVAQRRPEQSSDSHKNVPEPKKRHSLNVFCHFFKDFRATAANSAHKPDDVDTICAKYSSDSCGIVSESQKRRFSLPKNLGECSDTKISKIKNITFSSWRMKREVPVWSDDDA